MNSPVIHSRALMAPIRDALAGDRAFRDWFGGSELLGPNYEPMLVFRGLSRPYDDAMARQIPYQCFTDDLPSAIAYAAPTNRRQGDARPAAPNVIVAALAVRAPYMARFDDQARALAKMQGFDIDPMLGYWEALTPDTPRVLAQNDYDGLIIDDGTGNRDHVSYVAFRPDQVCVLGTASLSHDAWQDPEASAPTVAQALVDAALQSLPRASAPRPSRGYPRMRR